MGKCKTCNVNEAMIASEICGDCVAHWKRSQNKMLIVLERKYGKLRTGGNYTTILNEMRRLTELYHNDKNAFENELINIS